MTITVRQLQIGVSGDYSGVTNETETISYLVETDSKLTTRTQILASGLLPAKFTPHPDNALMTVRSVSLNQTESPKVWQADVSYSSVPYDKDDEDDEDQVSPLDKLARIRWSTTQFIKIADKDKDGVEITNSAGDMFDPPVEIDTSRFSIVVEKNLASIPVWVLSYPNTVNTSSFTVQGLTIPAKTAKMSELSISELKTEQGIDFYTLTFRMELANADEVDWSINVLDRGFHMFKTPLTTPKEITKILDDDSNPVASPQLLDGSGGVLEREATPSYRSFDVYHEKDFNLLPLT